MSWVDEELSDLRAWLDEFFDRMINKSLQDEGMIGALKVNEANTKIKEWSDKENVWKTKKPKQRQNYNIKETKEINKA